MDNEFVLFNGELRIDESRAIRCGFPEFIFGANKTEEQIISIIISLFSKKQDILITRVNNTVYNAIFSKIPPEINYDKLAKVIYYFSSSTIKKIKTPNCPKVGILTAGASDIAVALEAKLTVEACGYHSELIMDIGVAGIHRLLNKVEKLRKFNLLIVIAGMEGALPSVVGGLVSSPIIAVPTSVGYGASLGGIAALLAMINSCANGITVVNIDNGFGAGCAAARILNSITLKEDSKQSSDR